MTVFTKLGVEIASPVTAAGLPRPVDNHDMQVWMTETESVINAFTSNGGLIYDTRANLYADLAHGANTQAWVIGDATVAYNGIYRKAGASGAGSWSRIADLPYSFIRLTDVGAGTANAIAATSTIPLPSAPYGALLMMNVFEANTGAVTVAVNGATAKPLVTNSGGAMASGYLTAGMLAAFVDDGTNYRLLSDVASAAIQAAAEAAQAAAAASAAAAATSAAEAAASAASAEVQNRMRHFQTLTALKAIADTEFTNGEFVMVWGRATAGDGCDGRYRYHSADMSSTFIRQTISVLTGEIDAGTDKINKTAHGLWTGQACIVDGGDGLTANTVVYYIRGRLPNEITLHPSFVDAVENTNAVDITGATAFSMKVLADPDQAALVVLDGKALDGSEGGFIHRDVGKHRKWRVEWFPSSGPDDTDQIMRAVLAAGEGKRVKFHEDTLAISDRDGDNVCLWRLSGQKWQGVDRETSIVQLSSLVTDVQYVVRDADGAEYCSFEDLCFDGNRDNITPGVGVDLYSDFNLIVGPDGGAHNRWRRLKLINSWGRTLQTGFEAGSNNTTDSIVDDVIVRNAGTKAISLTENVGGIVMNCDVEVNAYTVAENPAGTSAGSGSCFESSACQDVTFENNRGNQVGATVKGPGIRIINGGSNVKAFKNWIEGASYLGFIQNCDDVEFAHNTGRNINGNAILISDDDTANPTDGCERIRVHHNKITDPTGAYVVITANKNGYDVAVEASIYENDFIKVSGTPTHGIYNNGVAAPATGGTCVVRQWNNNFVGGVPNEIAGPAAFEILPSPDAGWHIVDQSSVAVSHTGDTSEATLATISVLPHHMGKNGRSRVTAVFAYTNSANNKIPRVRFGGAQAFAATMTTTAQLRVQIEIGNINSTSSQSVQIAGVSSGWGATTTAASGTSINTTAPVALALTGQLANSGETITLVGYVVEAYHEN